MTTAFIYGKNNCVWCDRAKSLLTSRFIEWEFANIEEDEEARMNFRLDFPDAKTVPQIILEDVRLATASTLTTDLKIGTYTQLEEYLKGVEKTINV